MLTLKLANSLKHLAKLAKLVTAVTAVKAGDNELTFVDHKWQEHGVREKKCFTVDLF